MTLRSQVEAKLTDEVLEQRGRAFQRVVNLQPHTNGGRMLGDPAEVSRRAHEAGRAVLMAAIGDALDAADAEIREWRRHQEQWDRRGETGDIE